MPNYFAHQVFGLEVLSRLSPALRQRIEGEGDAFRMGLYGPDPLFFYRPLTRNFPRITGLTMHKRPVRPAAQALRPAAAEGLPGAAGYAAGFLCHFALDSRCHPLIRERVSQGLSHSGLESELDRALMAQRGIDPLHEAPLLPARPSQAELETIAAAVYPGVRPEELRKSLDAFRRVCRLQARAAGTKVSAAVDQTARRFGPLSSLRGTVLPPAPDPACAVAVTQLQVLLEKEVPDAAERVEGFFRGDELDGWYDRTFQGEAQPVFAGT